MVQGGDVAMDLPSVLNEDGKKRDGYLISTSQGLGIVLHIKGKQGSTENFRKIEVHPCGFWEMLLIESSFALVRNLGSKTQLFP